MSALIQAPSQGPLLLSERKCWHRVEVTCRISPKVSEDQHAVCRPEMLLWLPSQQGFPGPTRAAREPLPFQQGDLGHPDSMM